MIKKINLYNSFDYFVAVKLQSTNLYQLSNPEISSVITKVTPKQEYLYGKHQINLLDDSGNTVGFIRLPLFIRVRENLTLENTEAMMLYVTIESGNAAICVMQGKENIYHTTLGAYMSRKKQGFSQIKYLNKKGKSRAGSRVRLASTIEFFEKINTALTTLFEEYQFDRIAINCSTSLTPYLHQSKVSCPFDKKDERLYKIPLHLPQSNYTNLIGAIKKLMAPTLFYDEKSSSLFEHILESQKK